MVLLASIRGRAASWSGTVREQSRLTWRLAWALLLMGRRCDRHVRPDTCAEQDGHQLVRWREREPARWQPDRYPDYLVPVTPGATFVFPRRGAVLP